MAGEHEDKGSERVLPDPQFGLVGVLRPFTDFEDTYDGVDGTIPIMFTEGGVVLDQQAGTPGYSPRLLRGLTVPMGARIVLWLPSPGSTVLFGPYVWVLIWRLRNTHDYRTARVSYHFPKQALGVPESGPFGGTRVVLPCAMQSVVMTTAGPRLGPLGATNAAATLSKNISDYAVHTLSVEGVQPRSTRFQYSAASEAVLPAPFTPPPYLTPVHTGVIEQGVVDANDDSIKEYGMPMFLPFETYCMGDELLVACVKDQNVCNDIDGNSGKLWAPTWDFLTANHADQSFSRLFGKGGVIMNPDVGVYVMIGVVT